MSPENGYGPSDELRPCPRNARRRGVGQDSCPRFYTNLSATFQVSGASLADNAGAGDRETQRVTRGPERATRAEG